LLSKNIKTYTCITVILPLLYGCETWFLTLREEHKMRVSENMVLRKIFGAKRDKVTGEGRRLCDGQLNDLYCSPNIIWVMKSRIMRWAGHVARMRDRRCAYKILVGRPDGKRPFGRPMHRREDNLKLIFKRWDGEAGLPWLRKGTGGGYL
jgi:hypothetical protein